MDLPKYRMAKGGEKVGPSLDDIKWNGFSFLLAAFIYYNSIGIPDSDDFGWRGMFGIFLRNFVMMFVLFSTFHYYLYELPVHTQLVKDGHKFNDSFPRPEHHERDRKYTILSLCINSLFEIYVWKNEQFSFDLSPLSFIFWLFVLPFWREIHFFIYHRILHHPLCYKRFHAHHHLSYNPGPWSGLSMHPVESITYFTGTLLPFLLHLHPLHYLYANIHAQMASIYGHHGYDIYGCSYFHYLHHSKTNVNFGTPFLPLDILTDSWCTGA